jgi:hypothetical protein
MESHQIYQYFRSFYHCQLYSLSGYLHISSQLSFTEIMSLPKVQEWMDMNRYFVKLCPSQEEEMVPLGSLCYSNMFMHRDDLKDAIYSSPLWRAHFPELSPFIDIYLGEFLATGKKRKMLFVSGEKSKQDQVTNFFKALNNSESKQYPNASMMLLIPFNDGTYMSPQFRDKFLFNHKKFNGQSEVLAVGGLRDLQTEVQLKTGQKITLRELVKSIPASQGISYPLLFQHFKENSSRTIHMAVF